MQKLMAAIILLVGTFHLAEAQSEDYKSNAAISVNYSLTGTVLNAFIEAAELSSTNVGRKSIPSLQLTYDFGVTNFLSIGIAASYEKIGFDVSDYSYTNADFETITENYTSSFTRTSIALRPLFHYGNMDKVDMYSGLRIQFFNNQYATDSTDPSNDDQGITDTYGFNLGNKIGVGIVAYGIRYFITDNIGIGWELNIGRPYLTNLSVNARF